MRNLLLRSPPHLLIGNLSHKNLRKLRPQPRRLEHRKLPRCLLLQPERLNLGTKLLLNEMRSKRQKMKILGVLR